MAIALTRDAMRQHCNSALSCPLARRSKTPPWSPGRYSRHPSEHPENNGPTTLRNRGNERPGYAFVRDEESLRGGDWAQQRDPNPLEDLRTSWFRSAADAEERRLAARRRSQRTQPCIVQRGLGSLYLRISVAADDQAPSA